MALYQLTDAVKNYMRHLMSITTNADIAYRIAKEEMQMTRAEVRYAWRETARSELYSTLLRKWGTDKVPPRAWGTKADVRLRDNNLYIFKVRFYDTISNEYVQKYISAYSTDRISFQGVWDSISDVLAGYQAVDGWDVVSWEPGGILAK